MDSQLDSGLKNTIFVYKCQKPKKGEKPVSCLKLAYWYTSMQKNSMEGK